eukprot:jgi/Chrpa1/16896/Chrysochromulina_OHIO_Genome00022777-RA
MNYIYNLTTIGFEGSVERGVLGGVKGGVDGIKVHACAARLQFAAARDEGERMVGKMAADTRQRAQAAMQLERRPRAGHGVAQQRAAALRVSVSAWGWGAPRLKAARALADAGEVSRQGILREAPAGVDIEADLARKGLHGASAPWSEVLDLSVSYQGRKAKPPLAEANLTEQLEVGILCDLRF